LNLEFVIPNRFLRSPFAEGNDLMLGRIPIGRDPRLRKLFFGSVTRTVLEENPVPVVVFH
jgi:nucleotide-binding universal stress UspA family protein